MVHFKLITSSRCMTSGGGIVEPKKKQIQSPLTRAEILQKIAEIKQLLAQLIIRLTAEPLKRLGARGG